MTDLAALTRALRSALGTGGRIGIGVTDPQAPAPPLWPAEEPATARMRPTRLSEFAAGRAAARAAMADLGLPPAAVPMGADRAPCWPEGLTGTISHCTGSDGKGAAVALVARRQDIAGLGLDVEEDGPLAPDLWPEILAPAETAWLTEQPPETRATLAMRSFSAKEALYKAQYPLSGRRLGFREVTLDWQCHRFVARLPADLALPRSLSGQVLKAEGLIVTVTLLCEDLSCPTRSDADPRLSCCSSSQPAD